MPGVLRDERAYRCPGPLWIGVEGSSPSSRIDGTCSGTFRAGRLGTTETEEAGVVDFGVEAGAGEPVAVSLNVGRTGSATGASGAFFSFAGDAGAGADVDSTDERDDPVCSGRGCDPIDFLPTRAAFFGAGFPATLRCRGDAALVSRLPGAASAAFGISILDSSVGWIFGFVVRFLAAVLRLPGEGSAGVFASLMTGVERLVAGLLGEAAETFVFADFFFGFMMAVLLEQQVASVKRDYERGHGLATADLKQQPK